MNKASRMVLQKILLRYLDKKYKEVIPEKKIRDFGVPRDFRFDFYIADINVAIEINGGQMVGGRHNRGGPGYEKDLMKLNLTQHAGIKIYQFTYEMLNREEYKLFV